MFSGVPTHFPTHFPSHFPSQMTASNLAIVFGPTLLNSPDEDSIVKDMNASHKLIETLVLTHEELFDQPSPQVGEQGNVTGWDGWGGWGTVSGWDGEGHCTYVSGWGGWDGVGHCKWWGGRGTVRGWGGTLCDCER